MVLPNEVIDASTQWTKDRPKNGKQGVDGNRRLIICRRADVSCYCINTRRLSCGPSNISRASLQVAKEKELEAAVELEVG
jgi:hypothetical protein